MVKKGGEIPPTRRISRGKNMRTISEEEHHQKMDEEIEQMNESWANIPEEI